MTSRTLPWARMGAEFLVVFLGVTLSFIADDWRESRQDKRAEQAALTELSADLQADSVELQAILERMTTWDRSALWLLQRLGDLNVESDSVMARIRDLVHYDIYQSVSSAYVGLKDGGQMALIRDQSLRRSLVDYYEVDQPYMVHFDGRSARDYDAFRDVVSEHLALTVSGLDESLWPVPPMRFLTSWLAFGADGRTRAALEDTGVGASNWSQRIADVLRANHELRTAVEAARQGLR